MGNAAGRDNGDAFAAVPGGVGVGDGEEPRGRSNGEGGAREDHRRSPRVPSADLMVHSPPRSPGQYPRTPYISAPQMPDVPLQSNGPTFLPQVRRNEMPIAITEPVEQGIPTLVSWSYGGNDVAVEGSWDRWSSRRALQRSGTDHTIVLVLPSGIYHYRFIVDGAVRHIPDLPSETDEMGHVVNLLDVHEYVPENFENEKEFEAPPSPESSYHQNLPGDEDFAKDPLMIPPQLHLPSLGMEGPEETGANSTKPQRVVLNHLFIEKGWSSQSVVALGMSHRFQSKYVSVVLYKPLHR